LLVNYLYWKLKKRRKPFEMFEIVSVGNILTKERKVHSSNLFIHSLKHSLDRLPWDQFLYRMYVHNKPNMIKTNSLIVKDVYFSLSQFFISN